MIYFPTVTQCPLIFWVGNIVWSFKWSPQQWKSPWELEGSMLGIDGGGPPITISRTINNPRSLRKAGAHSHLCLSCCYLETRRAMNATHVCIIFTTSCTGSNQNTPPVTRRGVKTDHLSVSRHVWGHDTCHVYSLWLINNTERNICQDKDKVQSSNAQNQIQFRVICQWYDQNHLNVIPFRYWCQLI